MTLATKAQIGAIHALKARIGLDDAAYREALSGFGVGSSKDLSRGAAAELIDRFKAGSTPVQSGVDNNMQAGDRRLARGALRLDRPYAGVCRALWLSAWNLGLVRDRTDKAMSAFVKRQTGLDSLNWVLEPLDGSKAIEGLKAWIARQAGVEWPTEKQARAAGLTLSRARKLAVIEAQKRLLKVDWENPAASTDADLDEAISAFGRAIRVTRVGQAIAATRNAEAGDA